MKIFLNSAVLLLLFCLPHILAYKEIIGILDKATDLSPEELNALRPLFHDLQAQYDYIAAQAALVPGNEHKTNEDYDLVYESVRQDFEVHFEGLFPPNNIPNSAKYDTVLPTLNELISTDTDHLPQDQAAELLDLQNIINDVLVEAQQNIDETVKRALQLETNLLKLNKPKIIIYIYNALSVLFRVSTRLGRAAYCTYSHIPQLNASLYDLYYGINCYSQTKHLLIRVESEVVHTVGTIRRNVLDLANVYKKIAQQNTLLGKIASLILQLTKIAHDLRESYAVGKAALDALENQLPNAAQHSVDCATNFVGTLPTMIETVSNVTTCILYVEPEETYEFMKPEAERI